MNVYLVIYTTEEKTIYRLVKNRKYFVGKYNSYGWYIVEIQILYINKFISLKTYRNVLDEKYRVRILKRRKKEKVLRFLEILHETFK